MAKTRLNERSRDVLRSLARRLVACPKEKETDHVAYILARDALYRFGYDRYPLKDMEVLAKYGCIGKDTCIRLNCSPGGYLVYQLRDGDSIRRPTHYGCQGWTIDEGTSRLVVASQSAEADLKTALKEKLADYMNLIASSYTFESVVEIWPEAEQVRAQCGAGQLQVFVDTGIIERIRADVATRAPELAA